MDPAAELKERVLASVRRTPSPVRSASRREVREVFAVTAAVVAVMFFAVDGVHHALGRPAWYLVASVALWTCVALVALRAAWRGGVTFGAGSLTTLATVIGGSPAALLAGSPGVRGGAPSAGSPWPSPPRLARWPVCRGRADRATRCTPPRAGRPSASRVARAAG